MTQDEINQAEWENSENWSGPDWAAVYFSKQDKRTWVPKKLTWMGWTLNLGRTSGVFWLIGLIISVSFIIVLCSFGIIVLIL